MLERHHADERMIQPCLRDGLEPDLESRLGGGGTPGLDPGFGPYVGLGNEACPDLLYRVIYGGHRHDVSRDSSRHLDGL